MNEAVLEASGADSTELRRRKLDSLRYQNELIEGEAEEAATKPAADGGAKAEPVATEEAAHDAYADQGAGEAAKEELEALSAQEPQTTAAEAAGEAKEGWVERRAKEIHRVMEAVRAKRKVRRGDHRVPSLPPCWARACSSRA